jgi:hypothetical protein
MYTVHHEIIAENNFCSFCSENVTELRNQYPLKIQDVYYYCCSNCNIKYKKELIAAEQIINKNWIKKYEYAKSSK